MKEKTKRLSVRHPTFQGHEHEKPANRAEKENQVVCGVLETKSRECPRNKEAWKRSDAATE